MSRLLPDLSASGLRSLASAVDMGQVAIPPTEIGLRSRVPSSAIATTMSELGALAGAGLDATAIARVLRLVAAERESAPMGAAAELVWTGPEIRGSASRDTWVVARELFAAARFRVLLSCYTLHEGREILRPLAERMDAEPTFAVRLFVDVRRKPRDMRPDAELLREFADGFLAKEWSGKRRPEVFHDPRSLALKRGVRSVLHAKCIVIDESAALVTSANISAAAHERNIELGILVRDPSLARSLASQFDTLVTSGDLRRVPGIQ